MPTLLDHTLNQEGYCIRIWLDELGPDAIESYTRAPYQAPMTQQSFNEDGTPKVDENNQPVYEDIPWSMTQKQYEDEMVAQAMKLATQKLAQLNPQPVVVTENTDAIAEQQAAVDALVETPEDTTETDVVSDAR